LSIKWVHTDIFNKKFTRERGKGGSEGGGKALQSNKYYIYPHIHTLGFVTAHLNLPYQ